MYHRSCVPSQILHNCKYFPKRLISAEETSTKKPNIERITFSAKQTHNVRLNNFFLKTPHLNEIKERIPEKYLILKRISPPDNIYLIDREVAKKVAGYVWPKIANNKNQIVAETNAGLGLVALELLEQGVDVVRLYDAFLDIKSDLELGKYRGRVELFDKDFFLLQRYEYLDKLDNGNRVETLLSGVPKKLWTDDPVMTIIGTLPNRRFISCLLRCLILQNFITSFGRFQLFTFMNPADYVVLTAGPDLNLLTYKSQSVLFRLFFDYELLDKFPRELFLPWETTKRKIGYAHEVDPTLVYFTRICFKRHLPLKNNELLPFTWFVRQFFGRGTNQVIPTLEKWVPGSGLDVLMPKHKHEGYFNKMSIFTQFGKITPEQILYVFKEMSTHPSYEKSPFSAMVESHAIKSETIETNLDEHLGRKKQDVQQ